jgi:hypothetical protein
MDGREFLALIKNDDHLKTISDFWVVDSQTVDCDLCFLTVVPTLAVMVTQPIVPLPALLSPGLPFMAIPPRITDIVDRHSVRCSRRN